MAKKAVALPPKLIRKKAEPVEDPTPAAEPLKASRTEGLGMDAQAMMRFESNKKSAGVAFLLWIFFAMFGGHRFYLGRPVTGVIMLLLTITFFGAVITGIWALIDAFCIPGMIRDYNNRLADAISCGGSVMLPTR